MRFYFPLICRFPIPRYERARRAEYIEERIADGDNSPCHVFMVVICGFTHFAIAFPESNLRGEWRYDTAAQGTTTSTLRRNKKF